MKNNTALYVLAVIFFVLLFVAIGFEEKEIRELKQLETTVTELQTENANLRVELDSMTRRAEKAENDLAELESEQESTQAQAYIYNYHDSNYDGMSAKDYIAQRESGGDYDARNSRYVGKYQLDESMLNGDYSPENQEETAERYVMERYGSWENAQEFWDSHGWY